MAWRMPYPADMATLPSYQEATSAADWLQLIAPYCEFDDYYALCLVNRHFHDTFSPYLWRDLFMAVRRLGLDPGDDIIWWVDFAYNRLDVVSPYCRALIRILDARHFGKEAYDLWSNPEDRALSKIFQRTLALLPNVIAILLDGHRDLDLGFLAGHQTRQQNSIRVLSVAQCGYRIPKLFFSAPNLQNLVYLDISYLPGSSLAVLQPAVLPLLRVLKAKGRELHDAQFLEIAFHFQHRLWSLDVSENNITDHAIQSLKDWCISSSSLYSEAHSHIEGRLLWIDGGTHFYGQFFSVEDGEMSESFCHPERYFVDPPLYVANPSLLIGQDYRTPRSNGITPTRKDNAETAISLLSQDEHDISRHFYQQSEGLTHLLLSHNQLSSTGVQKLLHISNGHIEELSCDSVSLLPRNRQYGQAWAADTKLYGVLGAAHCFRPVISPNLRILRIHHSVVTNVPSLHMHGTSSLACAFLAEMVIGKRTAALFPQTFLPDMNPRLYSLTLTGIPRRSAGPIVSKVIHFLRLLSVQERSIQDLARTMSSRRSPLLLRGLRHLRLEFDHGSAIDDEPLTSLNLDAGELIQSGDKLFSFFEDERVETGVPALSSQCSASKTSSSNVVSAESQSSIADHSSSPDRDNLEYVIHHGHWNDGSFTVRVWIGPANCDAPQALRDYRCMVVDHGVKDGVAPVTPAQVRAGAPRDVFIYQIAWSVAVMQAVLPRPTRNELSGMSDVLGVLKSYRQKTRVQYEHARRLLGGQADKVLLGHPHYFWTGHLEVSTEVAPSFMAESHDRR